jgi:mono/diheme cytochrome c family protein
MTVNFRGGLIMRGLALTAFAFVLALPIGARAQAVPKSVNATRSYFSEAQASRGKQQYAQFCAQCHMANLKGAGTAPALVGDDFLHDYYSVNDLYIKVSVTMPDDNVHGLGNDTYLNILSYLLQANGLPAGTERLKGDVTAMKRMALMPRKPAMSASGSPDGFYTVAQAERGKGYFRGNCGMCHVADHSQPDKRDLIAPPGRGFVAGPVHIQINLESDESFARWRNVGSLFNKIRTSMPLVNGGALSTEAYADIAAYLLHEQGLPAGKEELKSDPETLMGYNIPEKGFTSLFNGKDFTGWGFLLGSNCTPRPEGCGQTEPGTTFKVERGVIVCSGTPVGYMYPPKKYLNFTLRLEYRFEPYPGMESDDQYYGNSGYLIFMKEHRVFPDMIEVQGMNLEIMDIRASMRSTVYTVDTEARKRAVHPVGQWNTVEIVSKDGQVWNYLNGVLVSQVTHHEYTDPGYIGLQSEGAKIYWRNIRIKEE